MQKLQKSNYRLQQYTAEIVYCIIFADCLNAAALIVLNRVNKSAVFYRALHQTGLLYA